MNQTFTICCDFSTVEQAIAAYERNEAFTFTTVTTEVPESDTIPMPQPKKLVVVNGRYTFDTELELKIGDEVVCEAQDGRRWIGVITALESDFKGNTRTIVGKWYGDFNQKLHFKNMEDLKAGFRGAHSECDVRMLANSLWKKVGGYQIDFDVVDIMRKDIVEATKAELEKWTNNGEAV